MANLKLVGSRLSSLNAKRNQDFSGKINMKTNIKISSLEKIKEPKDTIKVVYNFDVDYGDLGGVSIEGILFLSGDIKLIKDLLKTYNDKKFDSPEYIAITNLIIQKASIKAFELEEEFGLPIHIKLPTFSAKK